MTNNGIEPWGTSETTSFSSEDECVTQYLYIQDVFTICLRPVRREEKNFRAVLRIPMLSSFSRRRPWFTMSNAFRRSKKTPITDFFRFIALWQWRWWGKHDINWVRCTRKSARKLEQYFWNLMTYYQFTYTLSYFRKKYLN